MSAPVIIDPVPCDLEKLKHDLAPEVAEIRNALENERRGLRTALEAAIEIGGRLSELREHLPHGAWLPFLKAEFELSADTASRYVDLAQMAKFRNLLNLKIPRSAL
jgi:hypothetical protein